MSMRPRPQTQQIGHRPTTEVVGKAGHHDETKTNWGNTEDEPVAWNIKHFFPIKNVLWQFLPTSVSTPKTQNEEPRHANTVTMVIAGVKTGALQVQFARCRSSLSRFSDPRTLDGRDLLNNKSRHSPRP